VFENNLKQEHVKNISYASVFEALCILRFALHLALHLQFEYLEDNKVLLTIKKIQEKYGDIFKE